MQLFHLLPAEKDLNIRPVCELVKPVLYLPIRLPCSVFLLHPGPPALRQPLQCRPESLIEDPVTGGPAAAQQQQEHSQMLPEHDPVMNVFPVK